MSSDTHALIRARRNASETSDLPVLALSVRMVEGFDPGDPHSLRQRSVLIEPIVHPHLDKIMADADATKVGRYTWVVGLGEESPTAPFTAAIDALHHGLIVDKSAIDAKRGKLVDLTQTYNSSYWTLANALRGTRLYGHVTGGNQRKLNQRFPDRAPYRYGALRVAVAERSLYLQAVTHCLLLPEHLAHINLNLRPAGKANVEARAMTGAEAAAVVDWARGNQFDLLEQFPGLVATLTHTASHTIAAWPVPGQPARARVSVGRRVSAEARQLLGVSGGAGANEMLVTSALAVQEATAAGCDQAAIHPAVADVVAMHAAQPHPDSRLRDYQQQAVGLWLTTKIGYVNALAPGMGKTICTLVAMAAKSQTTPRWRGVVIVEANVRAQWAEEAQRWFPGSRVVVLDKRTKLDDIAQADSDVGDGPLLVIASYALCNGLLGATGETDDAGSSDDVGAKLAAIRWNDLVCDEAVGLRSTGSQLSAVLWQLRERSDVAVALTGTPINTGLDDLGRMLAWVRGDRDMFHGNRLSRQFDLTDNDEGSDNGLHRFTQAIGPLLFRRDKSEISDEIPQLSARVVTLNPTLAERRLATAAQTELRRAFEELVAAMEVAERANPDDPRYGQLREELKATRGAWLGGTTLARMASSDPTALLDSTSSGAMLLAGQGLVASATAQTPTKRAWTVQHCVEQVAGGERILIFTEFATVARALIADLQDHGLRVGAVLGGGGAARDRAVAAFRDGQLDLLVCTSAGERGLNLQTATTVIHYDLPWTPSAVVQRTGRVERIGATASDVKVMFVVMKGTIEERVASLVVSRAVTSMLALDAARGIDVRNTEIGRALGALALDAPTQAAGGKESSLLAITRELLAP